MRNFFSQFGKVIDATVMIDRDSSRSKGFGFVTFDDKTDVEHLIGLGGLDIEGKVVSYYSSISVTSGPSFNALTRLKLSSLNREVLRLQVKLLSVVMAIKAGMGCKALPVALDNKLLP